MTLKRTVLFEPYLNVMLGLGKAIAAARAEFMAATVGYDASVDVSAAVVTKFATAIEIAEFICAVLLYALRLTLTTLVVPLVVTPTTPPPLVTSVMPPLPLPPLEIPSKTEFISCMDPLRRMCSK